MARFLPILRKVPGEFNEIFCRGLLVEKEENVWNKLE